jgi:translation initiation factor 3 subunit B
MESLKEKIPLLDFSEEIAKSPELEKYIKKECENYEMTFVHPMDQEDAPKLNSDFKNYFLLCGLPIVDSTKKDKLITVLGKIFEKKNIDFVVSDQITMLMNADTDKSYGTAFVKCKDEKQAKLASASIHNFPLSKANTIMSSTFDEFERLVKVPEEYVAPKFADLLDLYNYAMDPEHDQFLIREDNKIRVKLNRIPTRVDKDVNSLNFHEEFVGPNSEITLASKKNAFWSPQGKYLVIFKDNILELYGGSHFELIREILHTGVSNATISPCEKYLITFSNDANAKEGNYIFWRIDTGELLRAFPFDDYTPKFSPSDVFKFSYDGKFCAKLITDHVAVYELPEMHLLEDKNIDKRVSINISHVKEFIWNPTKSMFCYWYCDDSKDLMPPKIGFVDIPSREVWNEKEINNGKSLKISWSEDGTKLIALCKLQRKKEFYNDVVIFDVTSRLIPLEIIKVPTNIMAVKWTSTTDRLALLANKEKKIKENWEEFSQTSSVTIYDIKQDKGILKSVFVGRSKESFANDVHWSENGNIFIACDTSHRNSAYQGKFFLYYVRTIIKREEVAATGKKKKGKGDTKMVERREYVIDSVDDIDDPKCDRLDWDPTCRFFTVSKLPLNGKIGLVYLFRFD